MEAMLPKLHGFDLCARITQSERKTPVIILTGVYKENIYKTEAIRTFGASVYLEKPCDPEALLAAVHRLITGTEQSPYKEDVLGSAISEAVALKSPSKTPDEEKSKADKKKKAARDLASDVDLILNETLAELGLAPGKKAAKPRPAPQPPGEPAPQSQSHKPKPDLLRPPLRQPHPQEPSQPPAPGKAPIYKEKEKPARIEEGGSVQPDFGGSFSARKKAKFPKILAVVGSVLLFSGSALVLFKPHKNAASPYSVSIADTALNMPGTDTNAEQGGGSEVGNSLEKSEPYLKSRADDGPTSSSKSTNQNSAKGQRSPDEEINPILPAQPTPSLEIPAAASDAGTGGIDSAQTPGTRTETRVEEANPAANPPGEAEKPVPAPISKTNRGDIIPLESADAPPQLIKSADPVYPPAALNFRVEGQVLVNCLISEAGDVVQVSVLRGIKGNLGFEKAAESAVRKWKFKPAEKDGVAVKVWKPVAIAFKLNR
jgi:protein TonB